MDEKPNRRRKKPVKPPPEFMSSRYTPRDLPQAIWVGDDVIVGPFCVHCGNPSWYHGPEGQCRWHQLHPLVPPPSCECHGIAPKPEAPVRGIRR